MNSFGFGMRFLRKRGEERHFFVLCAVYATSDDGMDLRCRAEIESARWRGWVCARASLSRQLLQYAP